MINSWGMPCPGNQGKTNKKKKGSRYKELKFLRDKTQHSKTGTAFAVCYCYAVRKSTPLKLIRNKVNPELLCFFPF
jgi:hypothetical protein